MKIEELFLKPVDRPIDGVIKADDTRNLQAELEEYVFTRDVVKGLGALTDRYLTDVSANGVWISGFFGSGKSHLLKMLSLLLGEPALPNGGRPAEILLPKVEDEILRADLAKCAAIPSRSILFNIAQKFDGIGGDHSAPVLEVFVKVLNELQGYYGKQGYLAKFERDLDIRGELVPFKQTYQRVNGSSWEDGREAIATATRAAFARAYAEHFGVPEADALGLLRQVREDYRVSIESFAEMVKDYIDRQPAGFRLNFFVDEVGQFIAQDPKLMLDLQTVAESLGTVCKGRSWIFVTSQADLQGILGGFRGMDGQDVSKIMGRFKTQLTLASADVREVIQKRLLAKKEDEPEALTSIYDRERENLQTLYRFADGSMLFNGWRGSDEFCAYYPFHPYQFDLFQLAIIQLSQHNAFIGQYTAVGERSMLEVFQEALKVMRGVEVGRLASFDLLYDGIAPSLKGDVQTSIQLAERQLPDELSVRTLKALFLLKWVRGFKATVRNVAILLIDRPEIDIRAHEKAVGEALALLEGQSYLQRNGDAYEFLTDTEKDIEVEIKNTIVDDSQVADLLGKVLFSDVLRDPKIRYEGNNQDYSYARKLDDQLLGKDADVAINIVTTDNLHHDDPTLLAMQNMGKAVLLAILPSDPRFIEQARMYLKTQKYVQQNSGSVDATRRSILDQRAQHNSQRREELRALAGELLRVAPLYLNGTRLEHVGQGDPRNRFAKAAQELISFSFPNLRMLKGSYSEATLQQALLEGDDLLAGGAQPLSEAEQEVLTYVMRNQNNGERTRIDEMIRHFSQRPYGWYPMAVLTYVARLFRMGKVELRAPQLLDRDEARAMLGNSRQSASIRVCLQEQFDPSSINALKKFHHEFFDRANPGTDARSVGEETARAFAAEGRELTRLLEQSGRYPFLDALRPIADRLERLAEHEPAYLVKNLGEFGDDLLAAKDDLISPIKAFMHGPQRSVYDEAMTFLTREAANIAQLPDEEVAPLRRLASSPHPYRGSLVADARVAVQALRATLDKMLDAERAEAIAKLDEKEAVLTQSADFVALDESQREQVLAISRSARDAIAGDHFLASIRDRLNRFMATEYQQQLTLAYGLVARTGSSGSATGGSGTATATSLQLVRAMSLDVKYALPYISTEEELDQWLEALRSAAKAALDKGHRISL